jgi:ATP-dependent Clp protease ATP-binding subunit ClpA
MFERFTVDARQMVIDAGAQSHRLGHHFVGCEHLLLALSASSTPAGEALRARGATPARVEAKAIRLLGASRPGERFDGEALSAIGIDLDAVRSRIESSFGPGALSRPAAARARRLRGRHRRRPGTSPARTFTPRAKRCLARSLRRALSLKRDFIGIDDVAVSLVTMDDGMAPRVLEGLGLNGTELATEIGERYRAG